MSTEPPIRHVLGGATMGTRWSMVFDATAGLDLAALKTALAEAVTAVDCQMSTWKPDSDLMRLNRAKIGMWVKLPANLIMVLAKALEIGRLSDGAFDIGLGDLVNAWGFGAAGPTPDVATIKRALGHGRPATHDRLELDVPNARARKISALSLDLGGIAKGFGVDELLRVSDDFGIKSALVSIDGELSARGTEADGTPWSVAVEKPDYDSRTPLSVLTLEDAAVATSGDYRHWIDAGGVRLAHTMDRLRGGPAEGPLASVSVVTKTCREADAWATALLVHGADQGPKLARKHDLNALFIVRERGNLRQIPVGPIFNSR